MTDKPAPTPPREPLRLPPNCRDVTAEKAGTVIGIVGATAADGHACDDLGEPIGPRLKLLLLTGTSAPISDHSIPASSVRRRDGAIGGVATRMQDMELHP
jgi:hypothetical protein